MKKKIYALLGLTLSALIVMGLSFQLPVEWLSLREGMQLKNVESIFESSHRFMKLKSSTNGVSEESWQCDGILMRWTIDCWYGSDDSKLFTAHIVGNLRFGGKRLRERNLNIIK